MASKELFFTPINLTSGQLLEAGSGTPESSVSATPGSIYLDSDGKLWIKESGSGNTGWAEAGSGGAAGSDTEIQFNDGGAFGASANLTFDSGNSRLVATELRFGAADVYANLSRTATAGTGNNFDNAIIATGGTDSNINLSIGVKGLGAFQLYSSSYSKNQAGFTAVDLQLYASSSTQTASGLFSTAVGSANTASAQNSTALGGANTASATQATAVGTSVTASGAGSTAIGNSCTAGAADSLALGKQSNARLQGMTSFASGQASIVGDRQSGRLHLRGSTSGATSDELTVGAGALSASNSLVVPEGSMVAGLATCIGWDGTDYFAQRRRFVARRSSAGNVTVDINASDWTSNSVSFGGAAFAIAANTTHQCVNFSVTGVAAKDIEWVVTAEWTELQT